MSRRLVARCVSSAVRLVSVALCTVVCAGVARANDLPLKQGGSPLQHFGYYFADMDNDYLDEIRPQSNMYVVVPHGYIPQSAWQPAVFQHTIQRCVDLGLDIFLYPAPTPAEQQQVFNIIAGISGAWARVKYILVLAETNASSATVDATVASFVTMINTATLSPAGKLFGIEFQRCAAQGLDRVAGAQDLCSGSNPSVDDGRNAANIQFVAVQAYADAWGSPASANNVAEVNTVINTARGRLPAGKNLILIGQGYDRNGTWTNTTNTANSVNIETLKDLQKVYYMQAYQSTSRVLAIAMFSYARWSSTGKIFGGARVNNELLHPHIQMAERIHGTVDSDGDGMPDMWEREWGLNPAVNDAGLDPDGDGLTNLTEFTQKRHPTAVAANRRFLAEGSQNAFFTTWFGIANANPTPARVLVRFLTAGGTTIPLYVYLPPTSHTRVYADSVGLSGNDFATEVESNVKVAVDRTMRWDSTGYGGTSETAVTGAQNQWYFAEGVTSNPFDLFYLLVNPNSTASNVQITYVRAIGAPVVRTYSVAANSRLTIPVDSEPGLSGTDVAGIVQVTSGPAIIAERAQYYSGTQTFGAGHGGVGASAASTQWFLAEGSTGGYFDLYVPILNPNAFAVSVTANYLKSNGTTVTKSYVIPAMTRLTILVDNEDPLLAATEVSTELIANGPIVAERVSWWPQGVYAEASCSPGVTQSGVAWLSADGEEAGFQAANVTFVLIANVSSIAQSVRVTVLNGENRANGVITYSVPARSRMTINVGADFALTGGRRVATLVESLTPGGQIVVERAWYWNSGGVTFAAGTSASAARLN